MILTSDVDAIRATALQAGATDVYAKPVSSNTLARLVEFARVLKVAEQLVNEMRDEKAKD